MTTDVWTRSITFSILLRISFMSGFLKQNLTLYLLIYILSIHTVTVNIVFLLYYTHIYCNALAASAVRPSVFRDMEGSPTDATNFIVPP